MSSPANSRIFGIAAHIDAGKTTVSERMLFISGVQYRPGSVDEGTATMDYEDEERERGITIHAAAIRLPWKDMSYTLVDTPGHVDFTVEVERCMRVLDGVVLVFDVSSGVEAQSETVYRQALAHNVVRIAFLNKLDKVGADWEQSLDSIRTRLGAEPVSLQVPLLGTDSGIGLADLVNRRLYSYTGSRADASCRVSNWPEHSRDDWEAARETLTEQVASQDEELLEHFVENEDVGADQLEAAIRRQTLAGSILPVLGGAALKGIGVEPLLDAIGAYLPGPLDVSLPRAKRETSGEDVHLQLDATLPIVGQIFKLVTTRHGAIAWVRIYQGALSSGDQIRNTRSRKVERVQGIQILHADSHESIDRAVAGEIVAVKGFKHARTGDGLCSAKHKIVFPAWDFPLPVISMAVEAKKVEDRDRLIDSFQLLESEDPTMGWSYNEETGQLLMSGMGELHLQVLAAKLQRDFHVEINLGQPRVAYRESLSAPYRFCEVFSRKLPGREVSVFLDVEFTPNPDEELPVIINDLVAEKEKGLFLVLKETARKALETELASGPMHGFPMSQIKARIHSCRASLADSLPSPEDLELALNLLVRELGRRVELSILEPWMLVELTVPEDYLSPVLGDLQAKGGSILQVEVQSKLAEVRALVALSKMLAYSTRLRSLSQGRGSYSMKLDRYRELSQEARKQLLGLA